MHLSAQRRGLIRELVVNFVTLALALWAAAAIAIKILLIGTTVERNPVLSLFFAPISAFAFPLLATAMGFSFAQGSATSRGSGSYKLGDIYDRLASSVVERFIAQLPPSSLNFLKRVADYIERNQQ